MKFLAVLFFKSITSAPILRNDKRTSNEINVRRRRKITHKYKMKTAEKINKSKTLEVRGLEHRLLHPDWQKKDNNFPVSGMRRML